MNTRYWMVVLALVATVAIVAEASATPPVNSAVIRERIFNDCPSSILTTVNNYPTSIVIDDADLGCAAGFANLHNWRFSTDGIDPAVFNNVDAFEFGADLLITGTGNGEAGFQISPWWSQDVDGRMNVRTTDGEVACFGGRLPFYSFTAAHGVTYAKDNVIHLEIRYLPNDLTMANPGTIEYTVGYGGMTYSSGVIPFDEGNPSEPYGTWGILDDARVGAHLQAFMTPNQQTNVRAEWSNIFFRDLAVPVEATTWGGIKSIYR